MTVGLNGVLFAAALVAEVVVMLQNPVEDAQSIEHVLVLFAYAAERRKNIFHIFLLNSIEQKEGGVELCL